jgi:hypothetical protein
MDCPHQRPAYRVCDGCTIQVARSRKDNMVIYYGAGVGKPRRRRCNGEIEEDGYSSCGCSLDEDERGRAYSVPSQ